MTPLTVTAELLTPPVLSTPIRLDGVLWAAWHAREYGGDLGPAVPDAPLPLARVEPPGLAGAWWWAASAVLPDGPEALHHLHRRPPLDMLAEYTDARSVNVGNGPDKALRIPKYRRIGMTVLTWTAVGDVEEVAALLRHVPALGQTRTHGHGWVSRWRVEVGGPPLREYARDVRLRPLPVEAVTVAPDRAVRRLAPLRPPYHDRAAAVPCWVPA